MRSNRLQREIDDLVSRGWTIEEETPDRVVMVDREFGSVLSHVLVVVLTVWFSMGLGNVVWGAYNYVSNSRRRVLWEDAVGCPHCGADVPASADYCPACGDGSSGSRSRTVESPAGVRRGRRRGLAVLSGLRDAARGDGRRSVVRGSAVRRKGQRCRLR